VARLDGLREVVLELPDLTFLDSSAIRAIIYLANQVPKGIVPSEPREGVRTVLQIVDVGGHASISLQP
jgi:anti-anti-sigma regulatory factor